MKTTTHHTKMTRKGWVKTSLLLGASMTIMAAAPNAMAQDADGDEIIATGIRQSLESALVEKLQMTTVLRLTAYPQLVLVQAVLVLALKMLILQLSRVLKLLKRLRLQQLRVQLVVQSI